MKSALRRVKSLHDEILLRNMKSASRVMVSLRDDRNELYLRGF